jgi:cell wall-associated NlpC family hydrolase
MTTRRLAAVLTATFTFLFVVPTLGASAAPSRASIQEEIDKLGQQVSRLDEDYNLARIKLTNIESQIRDTQSRKAKAESTLGTLRERNSQRAAAVYRVGTPKVFMILLRAQSLRDFSRKMSVLSAVNSWEISQIEELQVAHERADRITTSLRSDLASRKDVLRSIESKKRALELTIAHQRNLLARIDASAAARTIRVPKRVVKPAIDFASLPTSPMARIAVQAAYEQIGKPYRYGAAGPNAFDCSGLTMYVWGRAGVSLPHATYAQYQATKRVARSDLQPGDIVYYFGEWRHAGLYIGGGRMIHSVHPGVNVRIDSIDYMTGYKGAGRPGV